jgi:ribose/xylose/arabinose/galactoside ABC-type transport system permease subunit
MIGLVAMMVGFTIKENPEMSPILAVLLGMALGSVLGSFNGLIITAGGVPPIIATLGTLSIYRGLVFFYSQGTWVNAFEMPQSFKMLSKAELEALVDRVITQNKAQVEKLGKGAFGLVMGLTMKDARGKASPEAVSQIVKQKLQ